MDFHKVAFAEMELDRLAALLGRLEDKFPDRDLAALTERISVLEDDIAYYNMAEMAETF